MAAQPAVHAANPLCARADAQWPPTVANQTVRSVTTRSATVRAWGVPAIVARCGVSSPGPSVNCIQVSGIDWVMSSLTDGKEFVTYGRVPALEVLVPVQYSPEPLILGAFTTAARQIPQGPHRCST